MTEETGKSDTALAVEFIERGQDALGQANVIILVRPEKLMDKVEKEIERVRGLVKVLKGEVGRVPPVDRKIMDIVEWQNECVGVIGAKEAEVKKAEGVVYDLEGKVLEAIRDMGKSYSVESFGSRTYSCRGLEGFYTYDRFLELSSSKIKGMQEQLSSRKILIEEAKRNLQKAKQELQGAEKDYGRRKTDPKYYDEYVVERQRVITEAEGKRSVQVSALNSEIANNERKIEKYQEYIGLLIEKAIGQI